jgi:cell division protein FtsQ
VLDRAVVALGYGIAQVEITGHQFTTDSAIHDTLDLANTGSLLRFDSAAARGRIERLAWIDTARVTRVFPDRLQIAVTERKPFARWRRGTQEYLVDRTGRMLTAIRAGAAAHLPLVAGEGAAEVAEPLFTLLERYPEILARLDTAERIDGRRWTLRLETGPDLHLPADGEAQALARIAGAGVLLSASAITAASIDARAAGRMIVGRKPTRTASRLDAADFLPCTSTETPPSRAREARC